MEQRRLAKPEAVAGGIRHRPPDGEMLLVNGGSTTLAFAAALGGRRGLTVVTNHLGLPAALPPRAVRDLYLLGGQLRTETNVTLGAVGFAGSGTISADTAVIDAGGISRTGPSAALLPEGSMIAAMFAASRRKLVLADSSKFLHSAFAHIAALDVVDVLVTDAPPPPELAGLLNEAGVEIVCAGA